MKEEDQFEQNVVLRHFKDKRVEADFLKDMRTRSTFNKIGLVLYCFVFAGGLHSGLSRPGVQPAMEYIVYSAVACITLCCIAYFVPIPFLHRSKSSVHICLWTMFGMALVAPTLVCVYYKDVVLEDHNPSCRSMEHGRLPYFEFVAVAINLSAVVLIVQVHWWQAALSHVFQHVVLLKAVSQTIKDHDVLEQAYVCSVGGFILFVCGSFVMENQSRTSFRLRREVEKARNSSERSARAVQKTMNYLALGVRAPLHSMHHTLETLHQEREIEGVLNSLRSNAVQLMTITDTIVDLIKLRSQPDPPSPARTDMTMLLSDVVRSHTGALAGLDVNFCLSADVLAEEAEHRAQPTHGIQLDSQRFKRIVKHLTANAARAMDGKGVLSYFASFRRWQQPAGRTVTTLLLEVLDTGCGFGEGVDPMQLLNEFTDDGGDQGSLCLGLPLCHGLAASMHGRMGVANRTLRGAKAWVELPLGCVECDFSFPQPAALPDPNTYDEPVFPHVARQVDPETSTDAGAGVPERLQLAGPDVAAPQPPGGPSAAPAVATVAARGVSWPQTSMIALVPGPRKHVVVVDTDINCYFMTRHLKRMGCIVTALCNGSGLLTTLTASESCVPASAIFVDILDNAVQGASGLAAVQRHPKYKTLPVVGMGASMEFATQSVETLREFGCMYALPKPFTIQALQDAYEEVLQQSMQ